MKEPFEDDFSEEQDEEEFEEPDYDDFDWFFIFLFLKKCIPTAGLEPATFRVQLSVFHP